LGGNSKLHFMQTWTLKPGVIETDLDDELVLLDPKTQGMFSLNATGRVIWHGIKNAESLEDIAQKLEQQFTVSFEQAQTDVSALISELEKAGLIS
jgi:sensor domain CHASE-containing protein